MSNNNSFHTSRINMRPGRITQPRVCPWCPESVTKTFTMDALKKHVARKHPDAKQSRMYTRLFSSRRERYLLQIYYLYA